MSEVSEVGTKAAISRAPGPKGLPWFGSVFPAAANASAPD